MCTYMLYYKHQEEQRTGHQAGKEIEMNGYSKKYGEYMNKADKKEDVIKGIKKYLEVGMYNQVTLLEKELHEVFGMSYDEIEEAIYA